MLAIDKADVMHQINDGKSPRGKSPRASPRSRNGDREAGEQDTAYEPLGSPASVKLEEPTEVNILLCQHVNVRVHVSSLHLPALLRRLFFLYAGNTLAHRRTWA